ncbi:hypothetical protein EEB13_15620 [Rhodococcus sp. WS3]|uniref:hypothetical protein n=1 Tax=Rhodococcus sp. WS3 TaxID=2486271 RepID=UPI001144C06A|nr:hypothetical protein [Rhodococcus sp. WS3]ROZ46704.1 hypothetical protein EEB13_15620 [Rhodococcus sp. WS3]
MNGIETPARWSRTTSVLGAGALAVAITLGSAVGTASADSPVTDFGSVSFSVTNTADNTIYDINAVLNLPAGSLPIGMMIPPIGARASAPQAVNDSFGDSFVGTSLDFVLGFVLAAGNFSLTPSNFGSPGSSGW